MNREEARSRLMETLEDRKLSRGEKKALRFALLQTHLEENDRHWLKNTALELAKQSLRHRDDHSIIDWMGDVMGLLMGESQVTSPSSFEACFSPGLDCLSQINHLIGSASQSIDVCVFTITDNRIGETLIKAHRRGVRVRIVSDNEKAYDLGSDIEGLKAAGVPTAVDTSPHHMHHKFAIFDDSILLTGSYNWTRSAAENNIENVIATSAPQLLVAFRKEFERLWREFKTT